MQYNHHTNSMTDTYFFILMVSSNKNTAIVNYNSYIYMKHGTQRTVIHCKNVIIFLYKLNLLIVLPSRIYHCPLSTTSATLFRHSSPFSCIPPTIAHFGDMVYLYLRKRDKGDYEHRMVSLGVMQNEAEKEKLKFFS